MGVRPARRTCEDWRIKIAPCGMETESTSALELLIWAGTAFSLAGLAGLIWCILRVGRAKRAGLSDAEMRDALKRVIPLNLGALFLSVLGLMMVIAGIVLA